MRYLSKKLWLIIYYKCIPELIQGKISTSKSHATELLFAFEQFCSQEGEIIVLLRKLIIFSLFLLHIVSKKWRVADPLLYYCSMC